MTPLSLQVAIERWPIAGSFTIARGSRTEAVVVTAMIGDGMHSGRGECVPYARYGESPEGVAHTIEALAPALSAGEMDRATLQTAVPPGAARFALDAAFWDLEAKQTGTSAAALAGLTLKPCITAYTISLRKPQQMAADTEAAAQRPLLKIKLGGPDDEAALRAVRAAAPDATLIVDANEGWSPDRLPTMLSLCSEVGVALVEQPLPSDNDGALARVARPVPVCADESAHTRTGLEGLRDRYDAINIKLDKTGGLTEALGMATAARTLGFQVMVGCMLGTSLAMAPATLVAQDADFVDLDGPLLLKRDRVPGLTFEGSLLYPPEPDLWG
ncbi:MAG: N-acetyl-D-Glu racemase DgcA [Pseudomonadota bacterium]